MSIPISVVGAALSADADAPTERPKVYDRSVPGDTAGRRRVWFLRAHGRRKAAWGGKRSMSQVTTLPRGLSGAMLALCLSGAVALAVWPFVLGVFEDLCVATDLLPQRRCTKAPNKLLAYVAIIAAFPAILMLERLWPAARSQSRFSAGLLVDFLWFCFSPVFLVVFVMPIEEALRWVHDDVLGLDPLFPIGSLPLALQIAIVVVLSDFLQWLAHVIRHKSSFVWEFHKIHHSQLELNYFSASRIHPVDGLTINLVSFLPFAMLDANIAIPAFVAWKVFVRIYAMFTHSNIRTNMGPLKYVLVTPQSHRIHHSDRPEHRDKNFANMFAIWDFMFGTQCLDFDTYPATGVEDKNVPHPLRPTLTGAFTAFGRMLVYPLSTLRGKPRV
jgi:sterol desaturase/sphingolipid hydroxylase (fatty acid hydroxylase superfamily)